MVKQKPDLFRRVNAGKIPVVPAQQNSET